MARIDFRGWRIESDAECWILGKPKTRLNRKQQQEIYLSQPSYHASLSQALQGLLEREVRQSDAATASEIMQLLATLQAEIRELVTV